MNKKIFFLFLLFFGVTIYMDAQSVEPCGTTAAWNHLLNVHPELAQKRINTQKQIQDAMNSGIVHSRDVLVIPVVVHVVYKTQFENIPDKEIFSQLAVLNQDFRKKNNNFSQVHDSFKDLATDVGIEFCLAKVDPFGNPTKGITRTSTNIANLGLQYGPNGERQRIFYEDLGGVPAWNPDEYLNIWVCELGATLLGQASFPGGLKAEDGILIDFFAFGTQGMAQAPNNLGKTLVHEIGHYLNLKHVWGNHSGDCDEDDGISDTPMQEKPTKGCPGNRPFSCGSFDLFYDFMDYSSDACLAMFTKEQGEMMVATLQTVRSGLLTQTKCQTQVLEHPLRHIELRGNPAGENFVLFLSEGNIFEIGVTIYNIYGQQVLDTQNYFFPNEQVVDIHQLPQGLYFVMLTSSDAKVIKKLVVAR